MKSYEMEGRPGKVRPLDVESIRTCNSFAFKNKNLISQFQDIYDAILNDDEAIVETAIKTRSFDINAEFDFEDEEDENYSSIKKRKRLYYPFHLAVVYNSPKVVDLFLAKNADPQVIDKNEMNVLHNCVTGAFYSVMVEEKVSDMINYVKEKLSADQITGLLCDENIDGLRPLEYAAQQGTVQIMTTMMHLKLFCISEEKKGIEIYRTIDVTQYEMGDRHSKSPLSFLAYLSEERLKKPKFHQQLNDPLIVNWIQSKILSNIIPLLIWITVRLGIFILFFLVDNDTSVEHKIYGNNVSRFYCEELLQFHPGITASTIMSTLLFATCIFILFLDIFDYIKWQVTKQAIKRVDLKGRKSTISSNIFYQAVQNVFLCLTIFVCIFIFLILTDDNNQIGRNELIVFYLARIFQPICMMWSTCFFIQMLPVIGSKIISLKKMLIDMASFLTILFFTMLFFAQAYQSFVFANTNEGCVEEFKNTYAIYYTMFRMILNMYDTTTLNADSRAVFEILHIVFILQVAIMTLNFLIAIMSNTGNAVKENEEVILTISRLAVVMLLEDRMFFIFKYFYKQFKKLGFIVRDNKCYLVACYDRSAEFYPDYEAHKSWL